MRVEEEEETMPMEAGTGILSKSTAIAACTAMTVMYVGILYAPTLILRFPPPSSYKQFVIRRFYCAAVSSLLSLIVSSLLLLPSRSWKISFILSIYGIRADHIWCALALPFSLTSLMYMGSLLKSVLLFGSWNGDGCESSSLSCIYSAVHKIYGSMISLASDISAWRTLVVAPVTEELVFRACMIPLLICGGFNSQTVVFICPVFFSLEVIKGLYKLGNGQESKHNSHLNHLLEFYVQKNYSLLKTAIAVGSQLAITMVFGSYASFLFIRTGHIAAPLVAHIFCNFNGVPAVYCRTKGIFVSLAFVGGLIGFLRLLFPLTVPTLYNTRTENCHCWLGYCSWM